MVSSISISQDNNGAERQFFKDDFSNDTLAQYTVTGAPTIASGVLTMAYGDKIEKVLSSTSTTGKWEMVGQFDTDWVDTDQAIYLYIGDNSYFRLLRITGDVIWSMLSINGVAKILETTTRTLASNVDFRAEVIYDGTNYTVAIYGMSGAYTKTVAGNAPTVPSIGVKDYAAGAIVTAITVGEITYSPSVAFQDLFGSDSETRYMQLVSTDITQPSPTGTWATAAAGDVVVASGYMTLSSDDDEAIAVALRSYNNASGEIELSFDNNGDGGGGADSNGLLFGYQDILNHYKLVLEDDAAGVENLKIYKVVAGTATQLGTTKDVSATYVRGNKTWLKLHWDKEKGQMWAYLRDDAGVYPTTPDISDAFSAQFSYGKVGFWSAVTTAGVGNLSTRFDDLTIRTQLLIGETNVPATETGFYYVDDMSLLKISSTWSHDSNLFYEAQTQGTHANVGKWWYQNNAETYFRQMFTDVTVSFTHVHPPTGWEHIAIKVGIIIAEQNPQTHTNPTNTGTHYYIRLNPRASTICDIAVYDSRDGSSLGTSTISTVSDGLYGFVISYSPSAGTMTVVVDGVTKISLTGMANPIAYGYVGIGSDSTDTFSFNTAFDNLTISGTRYYLKPILRGAQKGLALINGVETDCTAFCNDCNWDTIAEYTVGASTSSFDTTNGRLELKDAIAIYPTGISMNNGHYAFLLKRSTGATDVFNVKVANNDITVTGAGVVTVGGTAYTGTALTSPVWVEFVATGTQIAVYSNGILIGTKTGLTLATSTVQMSRTVANIYVYATNLNALESTSTTGCNITLGGIPHGARFDTQEELYLTTTTAQQTLARLRATLISTYYTGDGVQWYYENTTDSSSIDVDTVTKTVQIVPTAATEAVSRTTLTLNADDIGDTIKCAIRRHAYALANDNQPAVFCDAFGIVATLTSTDSSTESDAITSRLRHTFTDSSAESDAITTRLRHTFTDSASCSDLITTLLRMSAPDSTSQSDSVATRLRFTATDTSTMSDTYYAHLYEAVILYAYLTKSLSVYCKLSG